MLIPHKPNHCIKIWEVFDWYKLNSADLVIISKYLILKTILTVAYPKDGPKLTEGCAKVLPQWSIEWRVTISVNVIRKVINNSV